MTDYLIPLTDVQLKNLLASRGKKKSWIMLPNGEKRYFTGRIPSIYVGSFQNIGGKRVYVAGMAVDYHIEPGS